MKSRFVASFFVAAGLLVAGTAFAHHGTSASYDANKLVTQTGIVTKFVWANPHAQLHWDVKDASGKIVSWGAELHSIALMTRAGWSKGMIKPGDQISVTGHPARAGTPYVVATFIVHNGKEYFRDLPDPAQGQ